MGSRGVWLSEYGQGKLIEGFKVNAIDTIAAGDTFNGAFVTALLEGKPAQDAARFANAAAAIAVTRSGAQPSVPWRQEIDDFWHLDKCILHKNADISAFFMLILLFQRVKQAY